LSWIERLSTEQKVRGSNPLGRAYSFRIIVRIQALEVYCRSDLRGFSFFLQAMFWNDHSRRLFENVFFGVRTEVSTVLNLHRLTHIHSSRPNPRYLLLLIVYA